MENHYSKVKYIIFTVLNSILIFLLAGLLFSGITTRICIQKEALPKAMEIVKTEGNQKSLAGYISKTFIQDERINTEAVQNIMKKGTFLISADFYVKKYHAYLSGEEKKLTELTAEKVVEIVENNSDLIYSEISLKFLEPDKEKLLSRLEKPLKNLNTSVKMQKVLSAVWMQILLIVCLGGAMTWMIMTHLHSERSVSTALKIYGITGGVSCIVSFIAGMITLFLPAEIGKPFSGTIILNAFIGVLICSLIFGIGLLWNKISDKKKAPDKFSEVSDISKIPDSVKIPEDVKRQFCRYCGKRLVNPDAKFCYQCGKTQE